MSGHDIREVGADAAAELAVLHRHIFPEAGWSDADFTGMLDVLGTRALIACRTAQGGAGSEAQKPQGLVLIRTVCEDAEILTLGVLAGERRRGIAARLLAAALTIARQDGAQSVFLEVAEDNAAAIRLYSAMQFSTIGRRAGYYRRAGSNAAALLMQLKTTDLAAVSFAHR